MRVPQRYAELVRYKVAADLRAEAARTYLGFLWWVLDPVIFMLIFYVLFGLLLQRGGEHFVQFLLIGLVTWRWFHITVFNGANALPAGHGLIHQTYLPKLLLPLVAILTELTKFAVVLALLLVFLWVSGFGPSPAWLALPALLLVQLALICGVTLLLAALVPFLPDLKPLIGHVLQMLFFLSGIFYDPAEIPEAYRGYFLLNPMAALIDAYREVLLHGRWPGGWMLPSIAVLAAVLIVLAVAILHRYDRLYPKLIRS
ncbi:MAG: ABC transporter permease [Candidatus Competibacteraceae bacterium]|nr:MAG: ABC transporter permease [Candidatus Competibacteraceae bacterium]